MGLSYRKQTTMCRTGRDVPHQPFPSPTTQKRGVRQPTMVIFALYLTHIHQPRRSSIHNETFVASKSCLSLNNRPSGMASPNGWASGNLHPGEASPHGVLVTTNDLRVVHSYVGTMKLFPSKISAHTRHSPVRETQSRAGDAS